MEPVTQRQEVSFEHNLRVIAEAVREHVDLRTMPFALTVPLEMQRFTEIMQAGGLPLTLTQTGLATVPELLQLLESRRAEVKATSEQILADKRATLRTSEGRVLLADQLRRAQEFVNEVARTIAIIVAQRELDSPAQHPYPTIGQAAAYIGPTRRAPKLNR